MSDLTTPSLPISMIDIEKDFNARTHMDEKELEGLAASLGTSGVVQPLAVRPGKGGRFTLVAGHRRFVAAQRAGLKEVPIVVSQGNAHLSSLVENIHREELDLEGTCSTKKKCAAARKKARAAVNRATGRIRARMRKARENRANGSASASAVGPGV